MQTGRRSPTGWTAPPDVAQTTYTPFRTEPGAAPVRLIVRRVKPTPGSQLALFATYSYHGFITDRGRRDPGTGGRPPPPRRDRKRHSRPQVRRRSEPHAVRPLRRQRRLGGGTGDGPQPGPLDGADRSGRADRDHQDPSATVLLPGRTAHPLGTPPHPASATALALGQPSSVAPWHGCERFHSQPDGARPQLTRHPPNRTSPANSRQSGPRAPLAASSPRHLALPNIPRRSQGLPAAAEDRHRPHLPESCPDHRLPLPLITHSAAATSYLRWIRAKRESRS